MKESSLDDGVYVGYGRGFGGGVLEELEWEQPHATMNLALKMELSEVGTPSFGRRRSRLLVYCIEGKSEEVSFVTCPDRNIAVVKTCHSGFDPALQMHVSPFQCRRTLLKGIMSTHPLESKRGIVGSPELSEQ